MPLNIIVRKDIHNCIVFTTRVYTHYKNSPTKHAYG